MKRTVIIIMLVLFMASVVMPAYADEKQAKRAENHKNIADFISDTFKLPLVLIGVIAGEDEEKIKKDLDYKDNQGLIKCLRKKEVKK